MGLGSAGCNPGGGGWIDAPKTLAPAVAARNRARSAEVGTAAAGAAAMGGGVGPGFVRAGCGGWRRRRRKSRNASWLLALSADAAGFTTDPVRQTKPRYAG
ncbi:hypothetical protein THICB1_10216 [Thiomonas arsenitoxydans]|uniref:Uncharacterized protein n=1 Tax=Thiomonas arsenitoxydans (strain DSM 22701 / CIP 110005 / 3As) TaxID=426114 RepID=A0ABM9SZY1_THIA3|nr:hypothetical protein THICB1_10216 [Thiomonas arsenitoxydans]CQR27887.1 hypothetical protein THICB6_130007 [Thiomonas arsenitoxydans]